MNEPQAVMGSDDGAERSTPPPRPTDSTGEVARLQRIPGDYQHRALVHGLPVQRYWHLAKQRLISERFPVDGNDDVLDIGCGSGVVADFMAAKARTVVGIDGSGDAVDFARATFTRDNLRFEQFLFEDLILERQAYSAAVCMEVFEHLDAPAVAQLLAKTADALRAGGRLLITTPNYRGVWPAFEWLADRSGKVPHLEGDQHVTQFNAVRLRKALTDAGFEVHEQGTFCTFAPFASTLSEALADRILKLELRANLRFGALLYAVARRR